MSDQGQPLEELELVDEYKEDMEEESLELPSKSVGGTAEHDNLEYYTFSEANPRFSVIMSYSSLSPRYYVVVPSKFTKELPQKKVSVVLNLHGKSWTMLYNGHLKVKTLDGDWKPFADDNELKVGDACFFELMENSETRIVFKVIILRTALFPYGGDTEEEPIIIE